MKYERAATIYECDYIQCPKWFTSENFLPRVLVLEKKKGFKFNQIIFYDEWKQNYASTKVALFLSNNLILSSKRVFSKFDNVLSWDGSFFTHNNHTIAQTAAAIAKINAINVIIRSLHIFIVSSKIVYCINQWIDDLIRP